MPIYVTSQTEQPRRVEDVEGFPRLCTRGSTS